MTPLASLDVRKIRGDRILLDLLSDKWTMSVLGSLCDHEYRRRFNAIRRDVPDISQKSLVQCLRRLEQNGLIARRVLTTRPLGVEYVFTELGMTLEHPVAALFDWTLRYGDAVLAARGEAEAAPSDAVIPELDG
ncbi:winged helix-turn-helix transcriptional regulator [Caulobacter sp. S45]|uniref:winged helix-turn-helix transcriptional regulator n=1 Tax=Caulobacter sp. S45 TaxID=1641861 RepID=UPI00352BB987